MKYDSLWKLSIDPADVLLENLTVPDLLLHVSGLPRVPAKHEQAGGEPVEAVNGAQVAEVVLLGEDEDDRVVAVPAARMHLFDAKRNYFSLIFGAFFVVVT
jgi:hypothetical protein